MPSKSHSLLLSIVSKVTCLKLMALNSPEYLAHFRDAEKSKQMAESFITAIRASLRIFQQSQTDQTSLSELANMARSLILKAGELASPDEASPHAKLMTQVSAYAWLHAVKDALDLETLAVAA